VPLPPSDQRLSSSPLSLKKIDGVMFRNLIRVVGPLSLAGISFCFIAIFSPSYNSVENNRIAQGTSIIHAGYPLGMRGVIDMMRLAPRHIIVAADRLEDCQASLEQPFHEMVDHALSRGWSLDEILVALHGLRSKEFAASDRAVTLH
jgi:hypothetical protein